MGKLRLRGWKLAGTSSGGLQKLEESQQVHPQRAQEKNMENLYVYSKDEEMAISVGNTVEVSKVLVVNDILSNGFIVGSDRNRYLLGKDWNVRFADPVSWPPRAGDVWKIYNVKYAAMIHGDIIVLEPMTSDSGVPYTPANYDKFLSHHPILVFRERP
jgi:hypothetical protein